MLQSNQVTYKVEQRWMFGDIAVSPWEPWGIESVFPTITAAKKTIEDHYGIGELLPYGFRDGCPSEEDEFKLAMLKGHQHIQFRIVRNGLVTMPKYKFPALEAFMKKLDSLDPYPRTLLCQPKKSS